MSCGGVNECLLSQMQDPQRDSQSRPGDLEERQEDLARDLLGLWNESLPIHQGIKFLRGGRSKGAALAPIRNRGGRK